MTIFLNQKISNIEKEINNSGRSSIMSESTNKSVKRSTQVKNPYLKTSKTTAPSTIARTVDQKESVAKVTPETGLEKFFVPKQKDNNKKKDVVRKLVPPDGMSSDDDSSNNSSSSLYYHSSNDESHKSSKKLDQDHMYKSLDYRHRGELQLDQGSLKAYRFIRNHFLIPNDIENNEKFGPHSGQCFEQRVIRAYTLGQLKAKKEYKGESLLVCSYCGDEGHKRDACLKLL